LPACARRGIPRPAAPGPAPVLDQRSTGSDLAAK
jgi:hypothetical protein